MSSYFVTVEFKVPVGHSEVELSRKVWAEEGDKGQRQDSGEQYLSQRLRTTWYVTKA